MVIWEGRGDMLKAVEHTLVCPINAVGVMGKGLALTMRQRFPWLLKEYLKVYGDYLKNAQNIAEKAKILTHVMGPDSISNMPEAKVLLFCTKHHWRSSSPVQLVKGNLKALAENWEQLEIEKLAIPMVGCGEGKLPHAQVRDWIYYYLDDIALPVRLYM